jgi:hypothetical protein
MKIHVYLSGIFALFLTMSVLIIPATADAQGCAGGKCGITTTCSPNSGPTGTQVLMSISSGAYPLDGKYEIWWSKSPNMSEDPTSVKLAEGFNERLKQSLSVTISVPEASNGTNYFHYIKAGRTEQMMNFAFTVTPTIYMKEEKVSTRQTVTITGNGFTVSDTISFYLDGELTETAASTDKIGSFTTDFTIPDVQAGTHVVKATAKKMFNQEATLRFKTAPFLKVEPATPIVGKTATVSGFGFAPNTEVSIKYDEKVVTSSPTSDKTGAFVYNFTVPEVATQTHIITATDKAGNIAKFEPTVESSPPSTPTPITPTSDRFGIMGSQPVTFTWMPAKDDSGTVLYTLEVADNLNFFPLAPGMRRSGLSEASTIMSLEPGTYYWRVQAIDPSGNKSKWALSPYAFQVGLINIWIVVIASVILLIIFIMLLRAFIQRVRGYYY